MPPPSSRDPEAYYYSSGEKVRLVPNHQWVAVDAEVAARLGATGKHAQRVKDDLVLVEASRLASSEAGRVNELRRTGAVLDVFDAAGARIVVLPEIRIEAQRPADGKRIAEWLAERGKDLDVQCDDVKCNVRLKSGGSREALDLANLVWKKFHPAVSHPRFVRIVPKPGTTR